MTEVSSHRNKIQHSCLNLIILNPTIITTLHLQMSTVASRYTANSKRIWIYFCKIQICPLSTPHFQVTCLGKASAKSKTHLIDLTISFQSKETGRDKQSHNWVQTMQWIIPLELDQSRTCQMTHSLSRVSINSNSVSLLLEEELSSSAMILTHQIIWCHHLFQFHRLEKQVNQWDKRGCKITYRQAGGREQIIGAQFLNNSNKTSLCTS
jgi:hypothetical protein